MPTTCKTRFALSIPRTLLWWCTGLASYGCMVALVLQSFWLIEAEPHRGRVHFITTVKRENATSVPNFRCSASPPLTAISALWRMLPLREPLFEQCILVHLYLKSGTQPDM